MIFYNNKKLAELWKAESKTVSFNGDKIITVSTILYTKIY